MAIAVRVMPATTADKDTIMTAIGIIGPVDDKARLQRLPTYRCA